MTRCVRLTSSSVRVAPPGVDAATGNADQMVFTTEYGGVLNVVAQGTINGATPSLSIPGGISNRFVLVRGRCISRTGSVPSGWTFTSSPPNPDLWQTGFIGSSGGDFGAFFVREIDNNGINYVTFYNLGISGNTLQLQIGTVSGGAGFVNLNVEFEVKILNGNI